MSKEILKTLPKLPGIYVFKGADNQIIYVGKAKSIVKRVSQYFARQHIDWKVQELIKEHTTIEHIITNSETEALLLEAQLIKKFKPKYNVLLKSGNPFAYILITESDLPTIKVVLNKKSKGVYFGPFLGKQKVRRVFEYLMRIFKLKICSGKVQNGCLDFHLGRCAGNCTEIFNKSEYLTRLQVAQNLLEGNFEASQELLKESIKLHNKKFEFEKSKHLTEYLENLSMIFESLKTRFSETKYKTDVNIITTDLKYKVENPLLALQDLQFLLNLPKKPKSIDCFDISHFQSSYLVGSCVRFTHGIPDKNNFRRFKIKTLDTQNDYAALQEIVTRRYRNPSNLPDVILIDGGKGQLNAIKDLFAVPILSLAKREETVYFEGCPNGYKLDIQTPLGQLLIALRDYTHHFAISYHKLLRKKGIVG